MEISSISIVESRQELMISPTAHVNAKPFLRTAYFLKPSSTDNSSSLSLPSLLPKFDPKNWSLTVNFHGWRNPSKNWKQWVNKMASLHAPTWRKAGIYDAIFNSTFEIHQNGGFILGVAERWCSDTNSFIFPWGEATITLEDMLIAGYSVLGSPVFEPLETEESKEVREELVRERNKIIRTPAKKACQCIWLKTFMDSGSEIEHEAFLSFWLSRFVLPTTRDTISECVFPIAIHLARGTRIALAPAVLSSIYRDLGLLKGKIVALTTLDDDDDDEKLVVTTFAPFQLVLIWVWERFVKLSPKPNLLKIGETRFAQWNNARCNIKNVRPLIDASKESFNWRPYTKPLENWDFPKFYREKEMLVYSDSDLDDDLLSFIMCLRVSELVGIESKNVQQYLPHRVARQFGFDQDLPGFVVKSGASSKVAWSNYIRPVGDVECFIPSRFFETDVTTRYLDWWNTLEFHNHSNFVTDVLKDKKKAEASLNRTKEDNIFPHCRDKWADAILINPESSESSSQNLASDPIVSHVKSEIKIEEIAVTNYRSVPPGFRPKRDRVHVEDSDSSDKDNSTIAKILKRMQNEDVSSNRQRVNWNNLSATPENHSSPVAEKTSAVAAPAAKSNDDCNGTPSQLRSCLCSGAVNKILSRRSEQVPPMEGAEDVDPDNIRVELGKCQSRISSVAGNDQTRNDSEVLKEAKIAENVMVKKEKQDVESTNDSVAGYEKKNINGYSDDEAAFTRLAYRIERIEKIIAARKALLCRR